MEKTIEEIKGSERVISAFIIIISIKIGVLTTLQITGALEFFE